MPPLKRDRPTIGVLVGWSMIRGKIPDLYTLSVLRGIQSAAALKQCNLLAAWGLGRITDPEAFYPAWPDVSPHSDFVPVGPWNTDGLIVFAPLRHQARTDYLQKLDKQGCPVLYIATGEKGPVVSIDNEAGIRQAITHLIDHGHRDIAFVAGDPVDLGDSASRLRAYQAAVDEFGLNADPRLVVPGFHRHSVGYEAAQQILNSGVKVTAMLASNDTSAIGAMQAIRDAGLKIPTDIAVIGFDDQADAIAQVPPLTSVHIPLPEMGEQALLLMLDHLAQGSPLESISIPPRLTLRQSCGCIPEAVSSAVDGQTRLQTFVSHPSALSDVQSIKEKLVEQMMAALPSKTRFTEGEQTRRMCTILVDSFYEGLKKGDVSYLQKPMIEFLHQLDITDGSIEPWQEFISVLRREMALLPLDWSQAPIRKMAEDLLHQARVAVSESAQRRDYRHHSEHEIAAQAVSELTAALSVTLDERQAVEFLESRLADVNIKHAWVALYQPEGSDPVAWSAIPNLGPDVPAHRFRTREFPPPGLYPLDEVLNLALVPIVFQDEPLGYVAFDGTNMEPYSLITRQLAATFKTARLYSQVLELSLTDSLTGLNNRRYFDIFLKNEVDRSRRFGSGLAVIMLDIDHFKNYNDTFGHPQGDKAIQFVSKCILSGRRSADAATRIGGEEFALILPDTKIGGALTVARKIRDAMNGHSDLESHLTLSLGISVLQGSDLEAQTLVQQADLALYEAKRTGRDRICIFQDGAVSTVVSPD